MVLYQKVRLFIVEKFENFEFYAGKNFKLEFSKSVFLKLYSQVQEYQNDEFNTNGIIPLSA